MPEDGNCLLTAVQLQLGKANMQTSVSQLRDIVSQHLIEHEEVYRPLTTYEDDYGSQCLQLKNDGYWNCQLFDPLPMVLSNATGARVRIYSSHITQAYTEIVPTAQIKPEAPVSMPFINLAYTAIQGREHYDALESIKTDTQNESATEQAVVTSPVDILIPVCPTVSSALPISSPTCLAECPEELNHSEAYADTLCENHCPTADETVLMDSSCSAAETKAQDDESESSKTIRKKNKIADPSTWKANERKLLLNTGKYYKTRKGAKMAARSIQKGCTNCRYKCQQLVSGDSKKRIFEQFWGTGSKTQQADFIANMVDEIEPQVSRNNAKTNRNVTRKYHFLVDGSRIQVCKSFFLSVLNVSATAVSTALSKKQSSSITSPYRRGLDTPGNKTPREKVQFVHKHIESFPALPSHYTRKDSSKTYLDQSLNVRKVYEMYEEKCRNENIEPVREPIYRQIFNRDFNIGFHKPKQDSCLTCDKYKNGAIQIDEYEQHINRKEEAREQKAKDKELSQNDPGVHACTFDMQQVLTSPHTSTGTIFYKRK